MRNLKLFVAIACATLLAACSSQNQDNQKIRIDTASLAAQVNGTNNSQVAEQLALAGEQLLTPLAFMYADTVLDKALEIDPKNQRARLYKALLKPVMAMKGIYGRIQPMIDAYSDEKAKKDWEKSKEDFPESGLKTFMYEGTPDIKDEKSAQAFLDEVRNAFNEARLFFRDNKDLKLTVNLNVISWEGRLREAIEQCEYKEESPGVYVTASCPFKKMLRVEIARPDVEVLQQVMAGFQIYSTIYNAYDLTGAATVGQAGPLTQKQGAVILKSTADFGKLRKDHGLEKILDMGSDVVAGVKYAAAIQNELCPQGPGAKKNRPGYLVSEGICVPSKSSDGQTLDQILRTVEAAISGQAVTTVVSGQGHFHTVNYETRINVASVLKTPVQDLKPLMPTKFDKCGQATNVGDETLGGLFPSSDASKVLTIRQEINLPCYQW